jgi:cation diffusion facilitator family transporter
LEDKKRGKLRSNIGFMRAFNRFHRRLGIGTQVADRRYAIAKAFVGGMMIALMKSIAAVVTGSTSMLAEAVHSWVSLVADGFRATAYLVASRPADETHPLGYGRESYVWALFGSAGTFVVGAQFGIWRGVEQLHAQEPVFGFTFGYTVLGCAFAVQAVSFGQALRFVRQKAAARDLGVIGHLLTTSDTLLRAVVTEDLLALLGLVIAGLSMALHQATGRAEFDGAGSIAIGTLMGVVGLYLINMNRRFLAGVPLPANLRAKVIANLKQAPEIRRVTAFFAEYIGPEKVLISARVELTGQHEQAELARLLRRLEGRIMENPHVGLATLSLSAPEEPDLN